MRSVGPNWTIRAMGLNCDKKGLRAKLSQYDGGASLSENAEALRRGI